MEKKREWQRRRWLIKCMCARTSLASFWMPDWTTMMPCFTLLACIVSKMALVALTSTFAVAGNMTSTTSNAYIQV